MFLCVCFSIDVFIKNFNKYNSKLRISVEFKAPMKNTEITNDYRKQYWLLAQWSPASALARMSFQTGDLKSSASVTAEAVHW